MVKTKSPTSIAAGKVLLVVLLLLLLLLGEMVGPVSYEEVRAPRHVTRAGDEL
jgi:hypothetical protein